jgi:hypothetical protein
MSEFAAIAARITRDFEGVTELVGKFPRQISDERERAVEHLARKAAEERIAVVRQVAQAVAVERDATIRQSVDAIANDVMPPSSRSPKPFPQSASPSPRC